MFGSLLRIATDVVTTAVVIVEPAVDVAVETVRSVDEYVVSPVADQVSEVCDSVKYTIRGE